MNEHRTVLDACLRADPAVRDTERVSEWQELWRELCVRWPAPIDQAIAGGFAADRLGWAFASGYQAAMRRLAPDLPAAQLAAFCVTEETGNRPRDVKTRISATAPGGWSVSGAKRWTTLGPASRTLLVVGDTAPPQENSRPRLRVARVPADAPGVTIIPMPQTRFVPEVPHAQVRLDDVRLPGDALLPGDGYDRYVKPFRTIEDIHVTAATLAYLLRETRLRGWGSDFAERIVAGLAAFRHAADCAAESPATHVELAGALQWSARLHGEADTHWMDAGDDPAAQRWRRDSALLQVASAARSLRLARAWQVLGEPPATPPSA